MRNPHFHRSNLTGPYTLPLRCAVHPNRQRAKGSVILAERYTQREVARIVGVDERRLRYWQRLRLVRPQTRWGERFYSFGDLVALEAIKKLTERRVPAFRIRRALAALKHELGEDSVTFEQIRLIDYGKEVAIMAPSISKQPFNPVSKQWLFPFERRDVSAKVHQMASRTAEEWFEIALECESRPELLEEAVNAYRQVTRLAPDWIEAHLNLGVAFYQLERWEEARDAFAEAVHLDTTNPLARYNLGCALEELGEIDDAIHQFKRAIRVMPGHADAHFNLALAYEKKEEHTRAKEHWALYLRYNPHGPWAETARSRLLNSRRKHSQPIPFPSRLKQKN
jgi:tetratricopeptide (TPR) repeat protein